MRRHPAKQRWRLPLLCSGGVPRVFHPQRKQPCAKDESGKPIVDESGNPLLECMCGNVVKGRFNPKLPYFTQKGSFWTNSTSHLLETTTDKERLARTRNMCHYSGYESVALIPMHCGTRTLGLIQLNDPRKNMFTLQDIMNYECIADQVGGVVLNILGIQDKVNNVFELLTKVKRT